jgi:uncharacterized metal-binding protein
MAASLQKHVGLNRCVNHKINKDILVFIYHLCMQKFFTDNIKPMKPIIYSCSGCSSAAQMANYMTIQIDRKGIADMSCIAGVGGNVKKLVNTARAGRKIIVIDGCPLACSKACLSHHGIEPDLHIELTGYGVKKQNHVDFDKDQAEELLKLVEDKIEENIQSEYSLENKTSYENAEN